MATTLWTPAQKAFVDEFLDPMVEKCLTAINGERQFISDRDDRPEGTYNPSDPDDKPENYKVRYVAQAMLEDLIEKLQEQV